MAIRLEHTRMMDCSRGVREKLTVTLAPAAHHAKYAQGSTEGRPQGLPKRMDSAASHPRTCLQPHPLKAHQGPLWGLHRRRGQGQVQLSHLTTTHRARVGQGEAHVYYLTRQRLGRRRLCAESQFRNGWHGWSREGDGRACAGAGQAAVAADRGSASTARTSKLEYPNCVYESPYLPMHQVAECHTSSLAAHARRRLGAKSGGLAVRGQHFKA